MSVDSQQRAMALFEKVLEMNPEERDAYLDAHCDDPDVRQRVDAMVAADAVADGLLDNDADGHLAKLSDRPTTKLPDRIGAYRVVDRLGEGGMANVYLGERVSGDFEQTVALKLILSSRRSEHWQSRFLTERQILASLRHSNIAQLLDGGITDDGDPYFAMEYVDGQPITDFCDGEQLTIEQRVKLLLSVCDAVSYAHGRLIVHRDLKPSNILVDRNGRATLLDFGIAKLITDDDTSRTKTSLRALTPDYAAPEQFAGGDVTTSVDVYALGGLLYELTTGRRPFADARGSALEIERNIREHGAPSFSRLESLTTREEREQIAASRNTSWRRLLRSISGDLENIALKALRAEPERRYASVEGFAADLHRYLDGLPVRARADTTWYRVRKFSSRHPIGVPLSVIAALGLVVSTGFALQQADEARTAATVARLEAAKANETRDFITSLFEFADPDKNLGDRLTARQLLDLGANRVNEELSGQPLLRAEMLQLLATTYGQLGLYGTALPLADQARHLYAEANETALEIDALLVLAGLHRFQGDFAAGAELLDAADERLVDEDQARRTALLIERGENLREQARFEEAAAMFEEALSIDRSRLASPPEIARDLYRLGTLKFSAGDSESALALLQEAAQMLANANADETTQHASIQHDIGVILIQRGDLDAARSILEQVRAARTRLLGSDHPDVAGTLKELAGIARQLNDNDDAEYLYLEALRINELMLGPEHPETANNLNSLAVFFRGLGDDARALDFGRRALVGAKRAYGPAHPTVGLMTINVGSMQRMLGDLESALSDTQDGLAILVAALGNDHHLAGVGYNAVAGVQSDQGDLVAAEDNFRRALGIFEATAGANHPHTVSILSGLASVLLAQGQIDESQALYERAVATAESAFPEDHPNLAIVKFGLARIAADRGKCGEARQIDGVYGPILEAAGQADRPDIRAARAAISNCR
ncbi:MAG: tetratricopeptide repeat protein [Woeseiaceae bacterium]|nr:tetratricopeptide repeat protein [Woeseiaceae bacterium]